ncbi:MAG TPA: GYF domain-containing protein [Rhizomicrobium sp.]|nr:GYF domain-containing protein [Rhizomicrobium sp.]
MENTPENVDSTTDTAPSVIPLSATSAPPPHPLDAQWHLNNDGQSYGPYTGHKFKEFAAEGRVNADSQVVRSGATNWHRIADDPVLSSLFPSQFPANVPPVGTVSAEKGATVVQVTNNLAPSPNPLLAFIGDGGLAAPKSPGVALLLSLLLCGAGQMYNGQIGKGILMLIGCVLLWFVLLGWIINIWSWIDAYQTAKMMNFRYQQQLIAVAAAR